MDIYASDEEKSEEIKRWWRENGTSVVVGIALGVMAIFGGRYWFSMQDAKSEQAAVIYQQSLMMLSTGEMTTAEESVQSLMNNHRRSAYAGFAAMEIAAQFAAEQENASAREYLQWVYDNARLSAQKELAALRLARIMVDEEEYEAALQLLGQSEDTGFASLVAELKGDIYTLQEERQQARAAYQSAIASLSPNDPRQGLLEMKRDDVAVTDAL
jgi:predicted negative regulator of RcsB-dependent stress response